MLCFVQQQQSLVWRKPRPLASMRIKSSLFLFPVAHLGRTSVATVAWFLELTAQRLTSIESSDDSPASRDHQTSLQQRASLEDRQDTLCPLFAESRE